MSTLDLRRKCASVSTLVVFAGLLAFSTTAAAQEDYSAALVEALGFDADNSSQVLDHELRVWSDNASGPIEIDPPVTVDNDTLHGSILLSTGPAADRGIGTDNATSDLAGDNASDVTRFSVTLVVPAGQNSLVFTSQFITSEYPDPPIRKNDNATLEFISSNDTAHTIVLGEAIASTAQTSPSKTWGINVSDLTQITLTFTVRDALNGFRDSALRVVNMYFSDQTIEDDYTEDPAPRDTKLPPGSYSFSQDLITVPGVGLPFEFSIYYNSRREDTGSPMGRRWSHSYDWFVQALASYRVLKVKRDDGGADYFDTNFWVRNPTYTPRFPGTYSTLTSESGYQLYGENPFEQHYYFIYTTPEQMRYAFRRIGHNIFPPGGDDIPIDSFDCGNLILKYVTGPNGNRVTLNYDDACYGLHLLRSMVDTRGNTIEFFYEDGKLSRVSYNNDAQVATFTHNNAGDLTSFTDPAGNTTTFTYNDEGRLLTGTDSDGVRFVQNAYEGELLVEQRSPARDPEEGALTQYLYAGDTHFRIDPLGNVFENVYNVDDLLVRQVDPLGAEASFAYDDNNEISRHENPLGAVSTMDYDDSGNLLSRTDALGTAITMVYDAWNNMTSYTDPAGFQTVMEYAAGTQNLQQQTDPLENTMSYTYWQGLVSEARDARGNTTHYTYNPGTGDLTTMTNALGHETHYTYDSLGRKTSETDPRGNTTAYTHDAMGRVLTSTSPLGQTTSYTYDAQGRLTGEIAPDGAVTAYTYSPSGQSVTVTDPLGNTLSGAYDAADRRVSETDRLGNTTSFDYDTAGHLTGVTDPAGNLTRAGYDPAGNRIQISGPNGATTYFEYDALGRLQTETDPLGNVVASEYDMRGNRARLTNARGQQITCTYDAANRLTGISMPDARVSHDLDENGNPVASHRNDNSTVTRTFDALNRMESRIDPYGNRLKYEYDPAGNLVELTYSDNKTVCYSYDDLNRLTQVIDWEGRSTNYFYDPRVPGRLLRASLPDGSNVHYYYDAAGRLIGISDLAIDGSIIFSSRYDLNAAGQCVRETVEQRLDPAVNSDETDLAYNEANQLVAAGEHVYEYDADGNLVRGRLDGAVVDLAYDAANQLTSVGDGRYEYDASGLRIAYSDGAQTVRYVHDTSQELTRLLEEHDAEGNIIARYVYGLGLISRDSAEGQQSIYHFDRRGSTVALTNGSGVVTDLYAYGPYGKLTARHGTTQNPFTFNGNFGVMDDGNGLYFMRSRYYAPALMRFVHRDRLYSGTLLDPQSLNRYTYGHGDPINGVDPNGDFIFSLIIGAVIGAVIGVAIEVAVDYFEDGEFDHSFGDYMGAMFTGLVTGAIGGPAWGSSLKVAMAIGAVGGAVGSVAGNALGQGIDIATGVQDSFNFLSMGIEGVIGGVFGAAGGAMGYGVKSGLKSVARKMRSIANVFKRSGRAAGRAAGRVAGRAAQNAGTFFKEIVKHSAKGGFRIGLAFADRHLPEPKEMFAGVAGFFLLETVLLY